MYSGFITRLKNIRKHSNADRLQVAECFGNSIIIGLEAKENDLVIYFPTDGRLSQEYAEKNNLIRKKDPVTGANIGGYLDENCHIKAIKLRGERSEGIVMPIESLSDYCDINELKEGEMITTLNGTVICQKYIPNSNRKNHFGATGATKQNKRKQIKEKKVYPFFEEHIDTAQLCYNTHAFKPNDTVYITLKMHGTSHRTAYAYFEKDKSQNFIQRLFHRPVKKINGYEYVSGTRRVVLKNFEEGYYGSNSFRQKWHEFFKGKLYKGEEVFFEIVGYTDSGAFIMQEGDNKKVDSALGSKDFSRKYGVKTQFTYGCAEKQNDIYIYRMTMTTEEGTIVEYPWELVKQRCEQMNCKYVPEFDKFLFTTEEDLMQRVNNYCEGEDPIGKTHIREGIVARIDNRSKFTAYKHKSFNFKVLEGIIKTEAKEADMEESQENEKE